MVIFLCKVLSRVSSVNCSLAFQGLRRHNLAFYKKFFLGNSSSTQILPYLSSDKQDRPLPQLHLSLLGRSLSQQALSLHSHLSHRGPPKPFLLCKDLAAPNGSAKLLNPYQSQCWVNTLFNSSVSIVLSDSLNWDSKTASLISSSLHSICSSSVVLQFLIFIGTSQENCPFEVTQLVKISFRQLFGLRVLFAAWLLRVTLSHLYWLLWRGNQELPKLSWVVYLLP